MPYLVIDAHNHILASCCGLHVACVLAKALSDEEENLHERIFVCYRGHECVVKCIYLDGKKRSAGAYLIYDLA